MPLLRLIIATAATCLASGCNVFLGLDSVSLRDRPDSDVGPDALSPDVAADVPDIARPRGWFEVVANGTVSIADGESSAQAPVDLSDNSVIFATKRLDGTGAGHDDVQAEVRFEGTTVVAERAGSSGTVTVAFTAVQFDPARVRIQPLAFRIDATSDSALIDPVDPSRAFVVFSHRHDSPETVRQHAMVSAVLTEDSVVFERVGDLGRIDGTAFVVEALDDAFAVSHHTVPLSGTEAGIDVGDFPAERTSFLWSTRGDIAVDDGQDSHVSCRPEGTSEARCFRNGLSNTISVEVQVVRWSQGVAASTGVETSSSDTVRAVTGLSSGARALVVPGMQGNVGAAYTSQTTANLTPSGYYTLQLDDDGDVEMRRGQPSNGSSSPRWQVVSLTD